ncbi:protein YoaJ, partial [Acinetobacter baumannii]|nr:protein YoaJ [Acinetobacter baumannii]
MKKSTIIMLVVAIVAVAGTQFGWWWSPRRYCGVI